MRKMARVTGLEPAASGVTGRRSNQLSYTRLIACKRGVTSPPPRARQRVLPQKDIFFPNLNQTSIGFLPGANPAP